MLENFKKSERGFILNKVVKTNNLNEIKQEFKLDCFSDNVQDGRWKMDSVKTIL
jgi:hypothetical protein